MLNFFKKLFLFSFVCFPTFAFSSGDKLLLPFFVSQSGAGGASLNEDTSYLINPATLVFHKQTKGAFAYSNKQNQQVLAFSFLDMKKKIPVAFTYQRVWSDSFKKARNTMLLSSGLKVAPVLSLGLQIEKDLTSLLWNIRIGTMLKANSNFALAVFLDKILKEENKNLKIITLATSYKWKNFFSSNIDISKSVQKEWFFKGGVQSRFHPLFSLQLGGLLEMSELDFGKIDKSFLSGGISFHSPKLLLEYGVQTDSKFYQHSLSLMIKI